MTGTPSTRVSEEHFPETFSQTTGMEALFVGSDGETWRQPVLGMALCKIVEVTTEYPSCREVSRTFKGKHLHPVHLVGIKYVDVGEYVDVVKHEPSLSFGFVCYITPVGRNLNASEEALVADTVKTLFLKP